MEVEYVLKAIRRFWWIVIVATLLGTVGGYVLEPDGTPRYESTALVLVVAPSGTSSGNSGDRYVASQLVIMRSPPIADRAAELAKLDTISADTVTFTQIAGTDVVRVIASATTPGAAQTIADAYVNAYLERSAADSGASDESTTIEETLKGVEAQLATVAQSIQEAMKPYTDASALDPQVSLPAVEQVAPELAAQREVLLQTYTSLLEQQSAIQFGTSGRGTGSQIVQAATLPLDPVGPSRTALRLALPVLGLLAGIAAATVLARLSSRVLDPAEVADELGIPLAGTLPFKRALQTQPLLQVASLPADYEAHVRELCAQAESRAQIDSALTIVVIGAQRASGATTLAAAMAARFGHLGSSVALIDLDIEQPDISRCFGIKTDGIAALLDTSADRTTRRSPFVPTPWPHVRVVGRKPDLPSSRPQRADFVSVVNAAAAHADVVVVDAGPMLAAAAAAVLAQHAQVVVLTIPVPLQRRVALERIAQQLASVQRNVLPVETPGLRRRPARALLERLSRGRAVADGIGSIESKPVTTSTSTAASSARRPRAARKTAARRAARSSS